MFFIKIYSKYHAIMNGTKDIKTTRIRYFLFFVSVEFGALYSLFFTPFLYVTE